MRNKIIWSIGVLAVILILTISSNPSNVAKPSDTTKNTTDDVYDSGWVLLVSSDLQGIDEGLHIGGMSNINVTATYQNAFFIRTKPIWGSTIITEDVDIQIQMKHSFGLVAKCGTSG